MDFAWTEEQEILRQSVRTLMRRHAPPDYVLAFDLYENGVSGSLKLDYGSFALAAKLKKLDWLPESGCAK